MVARMANYLSVSNGLLVTVHSPLPQAGEGLGVRVVESTPYPLTLALSPMMIFKNLIGYAKGAIPSASEEPIMPRRQLVLSETERQELVHLRDHARQP